MRIVTFRRNGIVQHGVRHGGSIAVHPAATSAVELAIHAAADSAAQATAQQVPLADVELLPPVPRPGKIICIGLNYRAHAIEGGNAIPEYPAVFMRGATSLTPSGGPILYPECSDKLDYEAELAVVIGRAATRVSVANALAHVAGYSCFNDGSVRDYQRKSTQWTMGKNFDCTGGFGPELVTPDELPVGASGLRIVARLNGQVMQDQPIRDMIFPIAKIIAYVSAFTPLSPGDVIATGTPPGVGVFRKPPVFLQPGDVCEVEIDGLGVLRNPVQAAD